MLKDNRKYIRKKSNIEILYPTLMYGKDKRLIPKANSLFLIDFSETGIAFISKFYIPKNSFLSFYLRFGNEIPFKTLVKIIWNKIENGNFKCGGEFIGLTMENIEIIRKDIKGNA